MQLQLLRFLIPFLIPGLGLVSDMSRIKMELRPKFHSREQLFRRTSKMIKCLEGKLVGIALCLLSVPEFIARVQRFWTLCFWQKDDLHLKQA